MPERKRLVNLWIIFALFFACGASEARSSDIENNLPDPSDRLDYFVFGGVYNKGVFPGLTNIPFAAPLEDNYLVGLAINYEFLDVGYGFHFGGELGLAGRFGDSTSGEVWGGLSARYDGIAIGPITIGLGFVTGLSAVSAPTGSEKVREIEDDGDVTLLYFAGPELFLRHDRFPNTDFVIRAHHRSGGEAVSFLPTLGNMGEASNAYLFGLRFSY